MKEICSLHQSDRLHVVHVHDSGKDEEALNMAFDSILKEIPHDVHMISGDDVSVELDQYATQSSADLLVLIKKEKGLFESIFHKSVIKRLTLQATIPFLIL